MPTTKQTHNKPYGMHHFINGVWTISIIDDFVHLYHRLKTFSYLRANLFMLLIGVICYWISTNFEVANNSEFATILSYITLTVSNLVSVFLGVYASMLLMPTQLSLLTKSLIMASMLSVYLAGCYFFSQVTKAYHTPRTFNFMESFVLGLTGLSIMEELIFIMQNTELMLLPLLLPLHQSLTLGTCFFIFSAISICIRFCNNDTFRESFFKQDIFTCLFYCLESEIIALTFISVLVTIWFNFLLLPIELPMVGFILSIVATLICSGIYYQAEQGFLCITNKPDPRSSLDMTPTTPRQPTFPSTDTPYDEKAGLTPNEQSQPYQFN